MLPVHHAAAAAAAALPLARRGCGWTALARFVAAAVLIDVDHYLAYVWRTRDLSLVRAYVYYRPTYPRFRGRLHLHWPSLGFESSRLFHSAAALLLLFVLARRWTALLPIAWGALFHRLQDELWSYFT